MRAINRAVVLAILGLHVWNSIAAIPVQAAPVKEPICGLVAMGDLSFLTELQAPKASLSELAAHHNVYSAVVIPVTWSQLEPRQGVLDTGIIDRSLAQIDKLNRENPSFGPIVGKLRVFSGVHAPTWVKMLDQGPVTVDAHGVPAQIGHFWSEAYRSAWAELQSRLARIYDANPLMGEVAVSSCSSITAEPFLAPLSPRSLPALQAAGYNDDAYRNCLSGAFNDYEAWKLTPLDFTFNPFVSTDSGRQRVDPEFSLQLMESWRSRLGARGVLANHGMDAALLPRQQGLYRKLSELGGPIEFQFRTPTVDFAASMTQAMLYHPTEVEVWNTVAAGGHAHIDADMLEQWRSGFRCSRK